MSSSFTFAAIDAGSCQHKSERPFASAIAFMCAGPLDRPFCARVPVRSSLSLEGLAGRRFGRSRRSRAARNLIVISLLSPARGTQSPSIWPNPWKDLSTTACATSLRRLKSTRSRPLLPGVPTNYLPSLGLEDTVYVAGPPGLVDAVKSKARQARARCYADPFLPGAQKLSMARSRDPDAPGTIFPIAHRSCHRATTRNPLINRS